MDPAPIPDLTLIYRGERDGVAWFETIEARGSANLYVKRDQHLQLFAKTHVVTTLAHEVK